MVFSLQLLWITPSWHISRRLEDREAVGAEISPCSCQRLGTTQEQLPSFLPRKEGWSQTVGSSPKALLLQGCTWARVFCAMAACGTRSQDPSHWSQRRHIQFQCEWRLRYTRYNIHGRKTKKLTTDSNNKNARHIELKHYIWLVDCSTTDL